jgi:histidinol-phosphatase (PHP family)
MNMICLERRDGHTHTELCPHGSREATEDLVRRAIELGFLSYSLTEHPPLPQGFEDPAPDKSCGMVPEDLQHYFELGERLKKTFSSRIELKVGLEIDFIPDFQQSTRELLDTYASVLEDSLFSIHFLEGKGGWRCVDHSAEDFEDGLLDVYGSVEAVHEAYWKRVKQAVLADLGPHKPRRLAHLSLVHKFQKRFPLRNPFQFRNQVEEILDLVLDRQLELDLDAAGLFKPNCQEIYPAPWIIRSALRRGIRFVYGSDTHSLRGVGQGFEEAARILIDCQRTAEME